MKWSIGGIIGKIALHSFYESSDGVSSEKDIKEAIRNFRAIGELKGLVLDLRENAGGFLGQAVRVAGAFRLQWSHCDFEVWERGCPLSSQYRRQELLQWPACGSHLQNVGFCCRDCRASSSRLWRLLLLWGDERTFGKGRFSTKRLPMKAPISFLK